MSTSKLNSSKIIEEEDDKKTAPKIESKIPRINKGFKPSF